MGLSKALEIQVLKVAKLMFTYILLPEKQEVGSKVDYDEGVHPKCLQVYYFLEYTHLSS